MKKSTVDNEAIVYAAATAHYIGRDATKFAAALKDKWSSLSNKAQSEIRSVVESAFETEDYDIVLSGRSHTFGPPSVKFYREPWVDIRKLWK